MTINSRKIYMTVLFFHFLNLFKVRSVERKAMARGGRNDGPLYVLI